MTKQHRPAPAQPPEDFQEYADARFGFKVQMPKRFQILPATVDPLSRMIRGLDELPEEEAAKLQPRLPVGFYDPDVTGELEDGATQPLRLIEYDALLGGEGPLSPEDVARMRAEMRTYMPQTLADAQMPGYEFLGSAETALGTLPALAFEYSWDGVRPGHFGGDHAYVVWALGPAGMYHVYHHCSGEAWEARKPELDAILASFALMGPAELAEEAAQGAARAAFEAAKASGESTEDAFKAGQVAYEEALGVVSPAGSAETMGDAADGDAADGPAAADDVEDGPAAADEGAQAADPEPGPA
jgi:hypothetical protein